MWLNQRNNEACYCTLQQIYRVLSSSAKLTNKAIKYKKTNWWFQECSKTSQMIHTAANFIAILFDSWAIIWERENEEKWAIYWKWAFWIVKIHTLTYLREVIAAETSSCYCWKQINYNINWIDSCRSFCVWASASWAFSLCKLNRNTAWL